jgi:hypothetical protein
MLTKQIAGKERAKDSMRSRFDPTLSKSSRSIVSYQVTVNNKINFKVRNFNLPTKWLGQLVVANRLVAQRKSFISFLLVSKD